MNYTRREAMIAMSVSSVASSAAAGAATHFVRFRKGPVSAHGIVDGDSIREIQGDLFGAFKESGRKHKLADVKLLYPCQPPKIFAVGLNYRSHLGNRPAPTRPEIFYKPITALQNPDDPILIPKSATDVHYEGELVVVIGKRARDVTPEQAKEVIFGVACGNDVSERQWQNGPDKDLQWWRAKGADTFAPLGPTIARGLDYGKLMLETRLNGQSVQKQTTSDLLFNCEQIVSWISKAVTLTPGDLIYTGTPGSTKPMKPGDLVEVEIEGIGILKNMVNAG